MLIPEDRLLLLERLAQATQGLGVARQPLHFDPLAIKVKFAADALDKAVAALGEVWNIPADL